MKLFLTLTLFILTSFAMGQNITAFADQNFRLYKFDSGSIKQIYYQPTRELHIDNQYVCFVDNKGDIFVNYDGGQDMVAQTHSEIKTTDNLLLVRTASVLRVYDQGIKHVLTSTAMSYAMGDSIVVWQDRIGGLVKYYYQDEIHEISMFVEDLNINPDLVGSNTFVYADNAGNVSVLWHNKFYPIYSSNFATQIHAGQDVVAFNDPQNQTFSAFDNGYVVDIDEQWALKFHCGDNYIYYKDAGENHKVFREEEIMEIGFDLELVDPRDSVIVIKDFGGITKVWYQMEIYQIFNTPVGTYQVDGGIVAYPNQWGGVSAFVRGKEMEITRSKVERFELHGNTIVMQMSQSSYWVWWNGKIYEF
jgi:hypothetical protein